jgi:hypothetical protein
MRGRKSLKYNPDEVITTAIVCPNCKMEHPHSYIAKDYIPVYGKCSFCSCLFRWSKTKTEQVIPASQTTYVVNYNYEKKN